MPGKEWWILKSWSGWEETSWEGENNQLKESINPGDRNLSLTQQASTGDNTSILRSPEEPPFANRLVRDRLSLCWHWKLNQLLKKNHHPQHFFSPPKSPHHFTLSDPKGRGSSQNVPLAYGVAEPFPGWYDLTPQKSNIRSSHYDIRAAAESLQHCNY